MTGLMDDEELNIYCEYVLMPRLEALLDKALEAGADAYMSVDSKGLPAIAVNSGDGKYIISYTPLDVDWEALMELERDSCIMLLTATLRLVTREPEKAIGQLIFPEENIPGLKKLMDILGSGIWMRRNALKLEKTGADVLPKLNGLLPLLDETGLEHTKVLYTEEGVSFVLVESAGSAYELSYEHFDEETYLLRIAYLENEDYADAMIFPEGSAMKEPEYYDKVLGIFERYSQQ